MDIRLIRSAHKRENLLETIIANEGALILGGRPFVWEFRLELRFRGGTAQPHFENTAAVRANVRFARDKVAFLVKE